MTTDDQAQGPAQGELFADPTVQADEADLFGDSIRPTRVRLDAEGDYVHGWLRKIERNVDLKTGFAPVDIYTIEGISGVHESGTVRIYRGRPYAVAALHQTLKNRLAEADPAEGERIAIRRDRDFVSNVEGPSYGKQLVAYQVRMPDRPDPESTDAQPDNGAEADASKPKGRTRKAAA
jgi:hypothetical protein